MLLGQSATEKTRLLRLNPNKQNLAASLQCGSQVRQHVFTGHVRGDEEEPGTVSSHRLHDGLPLKADIRVHDTGVVEYDDGAVRKSRQLGMESQEDVDTCGRSPSIRTDSRPQRDGVVTWCLDLIH